MVVLVEGACSDSDWHLVNEMFLVKDGERVKQRHFGWVCSLDVIFSQVSEKGFQSLVKRANDPYVVVRKGVAEAGCIWKDLGLLAKPFFTFEIYVLFFTCIQENECFQGDCVSPFFTRAIARSNLHGEGGRSSFCLHCLPSLLHGELQRM